MTRDEAIAKILVSTILLQKTYLVTYTNTDEATAAATSIKEFIAAATRVRSPAGLDLIRKFSRTSANYEKVISRLPDIIIGRSRTAPETISIEVKQDFADPLITLAQRI